MHKNIIFDLGNVLIRWDPGLVYNSYFKDPAKVKAFFAETEIFKVNLELDRGLPFDEGLQQLALEFPHHADAIFLWKTHWPHMIEGIVQESLAIVDQLHSAGYQLFALTNWSAETFPYVYQKFEFFKLFKDIVVSGRVKLIKPDPAIYQLLLTRNQLLPHESLFIDDNLDNVQGAKQVGIDGIHYISPLQLRLELQKRGILP